MSTSQYSEKNYSESNQQNINTPLITPYDKLTYLNSKGYGHDNQMQNIIINIIQLLHNLKI